MTEAGFASQSCRLPAHRLAKWGCGRAGQVVVASVQRLPKMQLQIGYALGTLFDGLGAVLGPNFGFNFSIFQLWIFLLRFFVDFWWNISSFCWQIMTQIKCYFHIRSIGRKVDFWTTLRAFQQILPLARTIASFIPKRKDTSKADPHQALHLNWFSTNFGNKLCQKSDEKSFQKLSLNEVASNAF